MRAGPTVIRIASTILCPVLIAIAGLGPIACEDGGTWSFRGVSESQWRTLAASDGPRAEEAQRVLLLMDQEDCRQSLREVLADLDAADSTRRVAALEVLGEEPAYRRWFPEEVRSRLEARAARWNAPVGDPRHGRWELWIRSLGESNRVEAEALVRALAADPNTALGMAGPGPVPRLVAAAAPPSPRTAQDHHVRR